MKAIINVNKNSAIDITTKHNLKDFVYPISQGGYDEFINLLKK